jgi:glycosyltransferase involved in cell wall biosynthesis
LAAAYSETKAAVEILIREGIAQLASKICVVIPAYNASETIRQVVRGALKYVPLVIVADDGSTDHTAKFAAEAGGEVILIEKNRGKGHALKMLFQKAIDEGYDAVISMDADLQHDPEKIPHFIQAHNIHPNDIIVGSRMHEKEKIPRARYNSMHVARFYISLAANQFIEDTQCGFRLYPLSLIKKLLLTTDRYVTETEILMKAGDRGVFIRSVRIETIYGNNNSHFRPIMDVAAITAYVISYLMIKWLIEGVCSDRPYSYSPNNIRDLIGRHKIIDRLFQAIIVPTIFPGSVLFLIEYLFFSPIIKNNFASIRRLNSGFFKITLATYMLPVLVMIAIIEKSCNAIGVKLRFLDRIIEIFYPHLWKEKRST